MGSIIFFTRRFDRSTAGWLAATCAEGPWHGLRAAWLSGFLHPDAPASFESPWRRERGALWDVGPHALSLALPLLGEVTDVCPVRGPGDTVQLALSHATGAASAVALSLTAAPAAATVDLAVYGDAGWRTMPDTTESDVDSLRVAIRSLVEGAENGAPGHPCDVRLGRDIVAVLETAESRLPPR